MRLIAGLGNPGAGYARNRHNIGYQVVELLARRHALDFDRSEHGARVARGTITGERVLIAQPQKYMNESGRVVGALARYYRIPPDEILVVSDDLDLPSGKLRLRPGGGAGGQRGVRSIIQHLGDEGFPRLRIGIGRPPGRMDPAAYVLQNFSEAEEERFAVTREEAADAIECWLERGIEAAMNRYN